MDETYTLTVTKYRENPSYAAEYAAWKSRSPYDNQMGVFNGEPGRIVQDRELSVTLTAEEWAAVKRGVLDVFK